MTAATAPVEGLGIDAGRLRRVLDGPAEGWLTLGGLALMVVALGWSIDDAKWVRGIDEATDFLPLAGLAGLAFGVLGPKLGWGRWTTHALGIGFAAILLPIIAGGLVLGDGVSGWDPVALATRFRESARVIVQVWVELGREGRPFTNEYGHYFIAFGAILWAAGQYAGHAVFGHRRALDAVVVVGLLLLANMALTENDQLQLMVLYSLAALVVLTRTHAFDERVTWLRRRIGDPAAVTSLYLRGGAVFISAAIVGSLFLTATASSAPLQGLWKDLPGTLVQISQWLQRYVPLGGESRNPGIVAFGQNAAIIGVWSSDDGIAFEAHLPSSETERFYWQAGIYSEFNLTAWSWGTTRNLARDARASLLEGTADDAVGRAGTREVRIEIEPRSSTLRTLVLSPQTIEWLDREATVKVTGSADHLSAVEIQSADQYTVTAIVPVAGNEEGQITANRLRAASQEYSAEIRRAYLDVPEGSIGPVAEQLRQAIMATIPEADRNPYDIARTMEAYLRDSSHFRYSTDVQDESQAQCRGVSTVECFARIKAGYCQYYATTMAILLRAEGIPTRFVQGFLPGPRLPSGNEVVRNSAAHAWVQVYFPGYGWIDFDPTGTVAQLVAPPSGPPESPTPRPSFGLVTERPGFSDQEGPDGSSGPTTPAGGGTQGPSAGPFGVIAALLLVAVAALAYVAWKRGPRPMHPDRAWGSIGRWASRFGLAPRPSQTVFEYAGTLGDALPIARPELATVANAKVEIAYGKRQLSSDRLKAVAEAHRRLRLRLVRLALRRPRPFRRPRRLGRG